MEAFSDLLEPHKRIIATTASAFAYVHQLSGLFICYTIYRQKSSTGRSLIPFLTSFVHSSLALGFGLIINDSTLTQVNLIKVAINFGYIFFYFCYTNNVKDKRLACIQLKCGGVFMAIVLVYALFEDRSVLKFRFGMIFTAVIFALLGSSFLKLPEIIRTKNSAGLPFPIMLTGSIITFLWFLYGVAARENVLIIQNGVFCLMGSIQVAICLIYPARPTLEKDDTSTKSKKNTKKQN